MKKIILTVALILLICFQLFATGKDKTDAVKNRKYYPGRLIVKFKPYNQRLNAGNALQKISQAVQVKSSRRLFKHYQNATLAERADIGLNRVYVLDFPPETDVLEAARVLQMNPSVEYAVPDYVVKAEAIPNDTYYNLQSYLPQIFAEQAWDIAKGDSTVVVGIVDTGTDWNHPDLAANIWTNPNEVLDGVDNDNNGFIDDVRGWDFVENVDDAAIGEDNDIRDNNPMDFDGHGTHTAGLAGAVTNNNTGIAAMSWNVKIMPLRIGWHTAEGDGVGYSEWMAEAFEYAADNGADVVNLSFANSEPILDAAKYAYENGVVIVTSAGNSAEEIPAPLSTLPYVISVAALDDQDLKASYASFGNWVTVSAPGGDFSRGRPGIYSTVFDDDYVSYQGSSMASPIVAGLAALVKSQHPDWTPAEVIFQVVETADNIDDLNPVYAGKLGSGRINAYRAVTETVNPLPFLELKMFAYDDSNGGNGNKIVEPGERVEIIAQLQNTWANAIDLLGTLSVENPALSVVKNSSSFPLIPGISNMSQNKKDNSLDPFVLEVANDVLPQRVKCNVRLTTPNGYDETFEFFVAVNPSLLLVDDDDGDNNVESFYTDILDSLGLSYDVHNHLNNGSPEFAKLNSYSTVVWACEWTFPSLNEQDRQGLQLYLNAGGNLFVSGQDIGWDLCDPVAVVEDAYENEFERSNGASKVFYENYLHARYLQDISDFSTVEGVADDPVGDGLNFTIFQPGRDSENQYPSEVEAVNDGVSIFNYPNSNSGAVRYAGDYRTVYFALGGFEAVVEQDVREQVMPRILNWLNGFKIEHTPLTDTEDSTSSRRVEAIVTSLNSSLANVDLYWKTDTDFNYDRVEMTHEGGAIYAADLPPQSRKLVEYFIFANNQNGYSAPIVKYSYSTRPDMIAPVITNVTDIPNSIHNSGPYPVAADITDNIGVDTSNVFLTIRTASGLTDSVKLGLSPLLAIDHFEGELDATFEFGDTVFYQILAQDISMNANTTVSEEKSFIIGYEDFEFGLDMWETDDPDGWGVESSIAKSGDFCINDHPGTGRTYPNNSDVSITLKKGLDLSQLADAELKFWNVYFLETDGDFGYVQINTGDDENWENLGEPLTGMSGGWKLMTYPLSAYVGTGFDNVRFRFRMTSDSAQVRGLLGWFIDDITLNIDTQSPIQADKSERQLPDEFRLLQNYPNPFNPTTTISFATPVNGRVKMVIYNNIGQQIRTLIDDVRNAGFHSVVWDGCDNGGNIVSNGIYLYQLEAANFTATRKMVFIK